MCEWGASEIVHCPAGFNGSNPDRTEVPVDACIAGVVRALNAVGLLTLDSCCGHGKGPGKIRLIDGRVLVVPTLSPNNPTRHRVVPCSSSPTPTNQEEQRMEFKIVEAPTDPKAEQEKERHEELAELYSSMKSKPGAWHQPFDDETATVKEIHREAKELGVYVAVRDGSGIELDEENGLMRYTEAFKPKGPLERRFA